MNSMMDITRDMITVDDNAPASTAPEHVHLDSESITSIFSAVSLIEAVSVQTMIINVYAYKNASVISYTNLAENRAEFYANEWKILPYPTDSLHA